jgi:hypothetical protein
MDNPHNLEIDSFKIAVSKKIEGDEYLNTKKSRCLDVLFAIYTSY